LFGVVVRVITTRATFGTVVVAAESTSRVTTERFAGSATLDLGTTGTSYLDGLRLVGLFIN
jgi:hypothetical protein